jgi:pre-rRNA-processing protein TSR3
MDEDVPLHIIHLDQDDPKKCTARKLASRDLAILHFNTRRPPRRGFLLDPAAGIVLGPDDLPLIERGVSLVALDCSWKQLDESLVQVKKRSPRLEGRTLPLVLAANPVSWGKPGRLSTVEALAMCLVLLDRDDQARRILAPFGWGEQFLILNEEPLKAYKNAETRQEILDLQWEFFDRPDGI